MAAVLEDMQRHFFVARESAGGTYLAIEDTLAKARQTARRLRRQHPDDLIRYGSMTVEESTFEMGD